MLSLFQGQVISSLNSTCSLKSSVLGSLPCSPAPRGGRGRLWGPLFRGPSTTLLRLLHKSSLELLEQELPVFPISHTAFSSAITSRHIIFLKGMIRLGVGIFQG